MRLIAYITDFRQVSRFLEHIGERTIRPPPAQDPDNTLPLDSEGTLPSLDSPLIDLRGCLDRPFPGL